MIRILNTKYYDGIIPEFFADLDEQIILCGNDGLDISICSGFSFSLTPDNAGVITVNDDESFLNVRLNEGFGVRSPVSFSVLSKTGNCEREFSTNLLKFNLEINTIQEECNNNETNNITKDDYFFFDLFVESMNAGSSNDYEVVLNASNDGSGGIILANGTYDSNIINGTDSDNTREFDFTADGSTTYTIT